MGTHAEFRKYAQQCVEIARKTNNPTLRENMLDMAQTWLGMAGASQLEHEQLMGDGVAIDGVGPTQKPDVA